MLLKTASRGHIEQKYRNPFVKPIIKNQKNPVANNFL